MKFIIVSLALFGAALAAPASPDEPIPILSQSAEVDVDGSFHNSYETGNGISFSESGVLKNAGQKDAEAEEVHGSFQYTAPDGSPVQVEYVANENGFQPSGNVLPTPPPTPELPPAIARALAWIAANPSPESESKK